MKFSKKSFKSFLSLSLLIVFIPLFNTSSIAQHRKAHKKKAVKAKTVHSKRMAHHRYSHLPKRGSAFKVLHNDAKTVVYNGNKYHYHNGIYYMQKGKQK